jgi:hypothetical protein
MKSTIRKRKASERGAALVETAFMAPMFVILVFSAFYAYNFGRAQIDVATLARQEAWTYSMDNCGQGGPNESESLPGGSTSTQTPITHSPPSASLTSQMSATLSGKGGGSFIVALVQGLVNHIQGLFPNPSGSMQNETEIVNFRIPNLYAGQSGKGFVTRIASGSGTTGNGAATKALKNNVTVYCNEPPSSGDQPFGWINVIAMAADAIVIEMAPDPNEW